MTIKNKKKFQNLWDQMSEFMRRRMDALHLITQKVSLSFEKNRKRFGDYLQMVLWPRLKKSTRRRMKLVVGSMLKHRGLLGSVLKSLFKIGVFLCIAYYIWQSQMLSGVGSLQVFSWWVLGTLIIIFLILLSVFLNKRGVRLNWKWRANLSKLPRPRKFRLAHVLWTVVLAFAVFFFWHQVTSTVSLVWNHRPTEEHIAEWKKESLEEARKQPPARSEFTCTITVSEYGGEIPLSVDDARVMTVRDSPATPACILSPRQLGIVSNEDFERMWRNEFPQLKGPTADWTVIEVRSRTYGTSGCYVYDKGLRGRWQTRYGLHGVDLRGDLSMEMYDVSRNLFIGSTKDDAEPNEEAYLFTVQCAGGDVPESIKKRMLPEPKPFDGISNI